MRKTMWAVILEEEGATWYAAVGTQEDSPSAEPELLLSDDEEEALTFADYDSAERVRLLFSGHNVKVQEYVIDSDDLAGQARVWMYHPESDSVFQDVEFDAGDGFVHDVTVREAMQHVANGSGISEDDMLLLLMDRDAQVKAGTYHVNRVAGESVELRVTKFNAMKKAYTLWRQLRELCGYVEAGDGETVTLFQDDATYSFHINVGKKSWYGNTLEEAVHKAAEARKVEIRE